MITARSELRKVLFFGAVSLCGFFVLHKTSPEPLNGFAPKSHGRRVWSLARKCLKVKVKGQGHQGQKTAFLALSAACVRFMFGKTSLASSLWSPYVIGRPYIFSSCDFYLSSSFFFFPRLISAVGDWIFTILWHMVWP